MKNLNRNSVLIILSLVASIGFAGCEAIGDIFKAGIWVGIIIVIAAIAIIGFFMMLFKK